MKTPHRKWNRDRRKSVPSQIEPLILDEKKMGDCLHRLIPPFVPKTSILAIAKKISRTILILAAVLTALGISALGVFLGYRIVKDHDTVWHYLKNNQTLAVTLTNQKTIQDAAIDDVLNQLTQPGKDLQQKLIELAVSGYAQRDWHGQSVVVYDETLRSTYQLTFENRIVAAIEQAYWIYNNFDLETERRVYGITTDELIYQKGLKVPGYSPMTLRHVLFEGRRYFPFALVAGQVAGVDPLRLLKIFEIESNFDEIAVGRNDARVNNDDIGIAQNNLAVLPGLIRDIMNPGSPVYSPFLEFLSLGKDVETGEPLTWKNYLTRLEAELKGTYNPKKDPTGRYYINLLKAPHISAFLAAYHLKRDEMYDLYDECMKFYGDNAALLKTELNLDRELNPSHWTGYTFYNGGPKRWFLMKRFLQLRQKPLASIGIEFQTELDKRTISGNLRQAFQNNSLPLPKNANISIEDKGHKWLIVTHENKKTYRISKKADTLNISAPIPTQLEKAVRFTTRRNLVAQRIGEKNEYLKNLAYDSLQDKTIQNDGSLLYGLYDFVDDFDRRPLMYNLNRELAVVPR